jgi:hypothetical protein
MSESNDDTLDVSQSEDKDGSVPLNRMRRAWYSSSISKFLNTSPESIIGLLSLNGQHDQLLTQRNAWLSQVEFLKKQLAGLTGSLFFEFSIPRMGRRIDTVLLINSVVFVIEFKIGKESFDRADIEQVWDYALDLKNFHEASHHASIVPILAVTDTSINNEAQLQLRVDQDNVYYPLRTNAASLRDAIDLVLQNIVVEGLDSDIWANAPYSPTPTIIEAARALYAQHSVEAIARYDAGAHNLSRTSRRIEELIDEARQKKQKTMCFVTGVPGAGKTLVGLNIATQRRDSKQPTHAVFLSGNGPLVAVLREALTRDEVARQKAQGKSARKAEVGESIKAFIQNVHHFRDEALANTQAPVEKVVIFDEAQRAWNAQQTTNFMQRKKSIADFNHSEPEFLIAYMDRHQDWAVVICLVGGGQEINIGEAGIDTWIEAAAQHFPHWHLYISSKLTDTEYAAGRALDVVKKRPNTHFDDSLHLAVSMRSFRAESVSAFVKSLLDCEEKTAQLIYSQFSERYPIVITRDLSCAKKWIREHARGSERYGLIASSKAQRLKPHAIDIRVDVDPVHWFLNSKEDTRSSYYLEDAATEFQVQGLEIDWACVTWDGDMRYAGSGWSFHDFRGDQWKRIKNSNNQRYLRNAYRVLLTRARQGMAIFVPPGDPKDPTRLPNFYDSTFNYLFGLGIPEIS